MESLKLIFRRRGPVLSRWPDGDVLLKTPGQLRQIRVAEGSASANTAAAMFPRAEWLLSATLI